MFQDPFNTTTVYGPTGLPMSQQRVEIREFVPDSGALNWGGVRLQFGDDGPPMDNLYELPQPEPETSLWPWLLGGGVGLLALFYLWGR
jgi:hypothetical protein